MAHQYRTEVIGSLLRPEYLKVARKRWETRDIATREFKEAEDRAVDEMIALAGELRTRETRQLRESRRIKP
jgi:5-methyltetrahydropteroyltriglutamate--homocysteine methyltransferase